MKDRADKIVVQQGLADSWQKAQALIMAGLVFSQGERVEKPGQLLEAEPEVTLKSTLPFVSRGGVKLEAALTKWNIAVRGKIAVDLGASTGGFSDCLLQRGARRIYAVDVDPRQLDWNLRNDSRIILVKKNARYLDTCDFPETENVDLVAMDLSFISILKVLPAVKKFLKNGKLLALIKPQFEVGKSEVGKKGIVRDPVLHREVLSNIINEAGAMGFFIKGLMKTPILGRKGNQEFFSLWSLSAKPIFAAEVKTLIQEVVGHEKN